MKNMIKYVLIFVVGALVLSSCEDLESNYASMTKDFDKNNTKYYIQYLNATQSFETAINEAGQPTDIVTTVGVAIQGAPQSSDVTVSLVVAPESTLPADAYTLSATSVVIPAGATSGSVDLTVLADQMTENEVVNLVLNMDAGGAEAATAAQLNYSLKRIKFCPLDDLADLAGNWGGVDDWGDIESMTTSVVDGAMMMQGLGVVWLADQWGEPLEAINDVVITMNPNGTLVIEEQPYCTTTYNGAPYDYTIVGSGTWDNCEKTMIISYDMQNTTDGYYLSDYGYAPITAEMSLK